MAERKFAFFCTCSFNFFGGFPVYYLTKGMLFYFNCYFEKWEKIFRNILKRVLENSYQINYFQKILLLFIPWCKNACCGIKKPEAHLWKTTVLCREFDQDIQQSCLLLQLISVWFCKQQFDDFTFFASSIGRNLCFIIYFIVAIFSFTLAFHMFNIPTHSKSKEWLSSIFIWAL